MIVNSFSCMTHHLMIIHHHTKFGKNGWVVQDISCGHDRKHGHDDRGQTDRVIPTHPPYLWGWGCVIKFLKRKKETETAWVGPEKSPWSAPDRVRNRRMGESQRNGQNTELLQSHFSRAVPWFCYFRWFPRGKEFPNTVRTFKHSHRLHEI